MTNKTQKTYRITTKARTYDCIHGRAHFQQVRAAWDDTTKVIRAYAWDSYLGQWLRQIAPLRW